MVDAHDRPQTGDSRTWVVHLLAVALQRSDTKLLLLAAGAVIVAGVLVAAVLLLATSRGRESDEVHGVPGRRATAIHSELKKGGPFFDPDPFGGDRNILLALEDGKVVALDDLKPGTKDCRVRWRGSINSFVDCHDDKVRSTDLARYQSEIGELGNNKGELLVDLRHREPGARPRAEAQLHLLQRRPREQQPLLADVAEVHDRFGLVAVADQLEDDALAELVVADVVADAQPHALGAARRRVRSGCRIGGPSDASPPRPPRGGARRGRGDGWCHCRRTCGRARARPSTCTSSSGISERKRLGG